MLERTLLSQLLAISMPRAFASLYSCKTEMYVLSVLYIHIEHANAAKGPSEVSFEWKNASEHNYL